MTTITKDRKQYEGVTLVENDPDVDLVPIMFDALYAYYSKDRDKVHISDILLCPREAAFRKIDPHPTTARELNYFFVGRSWHDNAQLLAEMFKTDDSVKEAYLQMLKWKYPTREFVSEMEFKRKEILIGHIDIYDKTKNIPYELKTYRGFKPEENPKTFNIHQLKCYMAMTNSKIGGLVYFYLNEFEEKEMFETYKVTMTDQEIKEMLEWMDVNAQSFKVAVEQKNPELASHIFYNNDLNWKCEKTYNKTDKKTGEIISSKTYRNCKYYDECAAMRARETKEKYIQAGGKV